MKRKSENGCRYMSLLAGAALLAAGLLAGCGSSKNSWEAAQAADTASEATAVAYPAEDIYDGTWAEAKIAEEADAGGGTGSPMVQDTSRKLIRTVNLDVETEAFEELLATVTQKTEAFGGYIENSYTYNGSAYYGRNTRNASMTIRIPSQSFEAFLSTVAEVSNVISRNESVSDVTLQYVDMDSHKKALQAEQERLLELMEQVETIEDMIALESRLSEVRYQIESMESQLRTLDNQVSYSTLYLEVQEVEKLTPVKEQTIWEKMATGFGNSLHGIGTGLVDFFIGVVIYLPYLVIWGVILLLIVLLIRKLVKRRKNRKLSREKQQEKGKKKEEKEEKKEEQV